MPREGDLVDELITALEMAEQADSHRCEKCFGDFGPCPTAASLAERARELRRAALERVGS